VTSATRRGLFGGIAAAGVSRLLGAARVPAGPDRANKSPAVATFPPIDAARVARRIVASVRPSSGERAVLVCDPAYYPDLALAVERELLDAGVYPFLALGFEPPEIVDALDRRPGLERRQDELVALLEPVFEKTDLFFWLPALRVADDTRFEHLLDGSRARGIHFHWVFEPLGKSAEEIATASRLYERAIFETDYAALSARQDRIIAALRGRALRLTTSDGTDLELRVPPDAWFHKNDGDMSPERARRARGVRDREMEFPAGALRFLPDTERVEGRLVVRRVSTPSGVAEGVALEFERGRVRGFRVGRGEAGFRAEWQRIGGDVDRVGEIVLGANPLLVGKLSSGELPYFGYGEGYVRVSLGDNWESGGANRCPLNRNLWLFLDDATLKAEGSSVIEKGRLVVS